MLITAVALALLLLTHNDTQHALPRRLPAAHFAALLGDLQRNARRQCEATRSGSVGANGRVLVRS